MNSYWTRLYLTLSLFLFSIVSIGQTNWQDTLDKYVQTPPPVSIKGLEKVFLETSLPDTTRLDMMVAIINDYAQTRQPDSARAYAIRSYALAQKLNDKRRTARSALSMAWTARDFGKTEEVIEKALEAEVIAKELSDTSMLIMSSNTIASVYYDVKNDSLQKLYLEKAYHLATLSGQENKALNSMSNLGYIYLKEKQYKKAEDLFRKVIAVRESFPYRNYAALYLLYAHLIDLFEEQEKYGDCVTYTDTLISITKQGGWNDYYIMQQNLKTLFQKLDGQSVSLNKKLLDQFNAVDVSSMTIDDKKIFLWNKSRLNRMFSQYKEALDYTNDYMIINDSMNQMKVRDQIAFYKEQFDAEQRDKKILALENEKVIADLKSEQQANKITWLVISLILVALFSVFLFVIYSKLKKTKAELEELNQVKDKFFAIVSHDLRNSVTAFQGIGQIIESYVKKEKWDRLIKLGSKMDNEAAKLGAFLNDLLNWSLTQVKRAPYNPQTISIDQKVKDVIHLMDSQIQSKKLEIEINTATDHSVYADQDALLLVIRNLVSNAVKFSHENGRISINSKVTNNHIEVSVSDQGIGMEKEKVATLFSPTSKKSEKGTQGETGSGLGLIIVKEFLEINKGSIDVSSQIGKGTSFSFSLPKG